MASTREDIMTATKDLVRRINISIISRLISISMFWGMGTAFILIIAGKFVFIPISPILVVVLILCVSLLAGLIRGLMARVSVLDAAILADARSDFKERLGSAVELLEKGDMREMAELQSEDAANYARSLDQKAVCPRMIPITARVLPAALLILIILMYALAPYGRAAQIPEEVRLAARKAGSEMEMAVGRIDRDSLSDRAAELAAKMEKAGQEFQDEPVTKKEALKDLSKLDREAEVLKAIGEIAENLLDDMTPERKRMLNELLKELSENLKDMPQMAELSEEVLQALQENMSPESLKQLAATLEQMGIKPSDAEALQKMMDQLAKGKRDMGQSMARSPKDKGDGKENELTAEEESGLMGSGAPGKKTASEMKEDIESASHRPISPDQGYDSQLDGQVSEGGRSVTDDGEAEDESGQSTVPYEQVYMQYRDTADDVISRQEIPWIYKENVKSYFDAIRPEGGGASE